MMTLSYTHHNLNMHVSQLFVSELLGGGGQTSEAVLGHGEVKLFSKLE